MASTPPAPAPVLPPLEEMRAAVRARDHGYEGVFVFGVRTTGVYCRPGCPARTPRPENLSFHVDSRGAEAAGLRPCRRCRPDRAVPTAPGWVLALEAEVGQQGARHVSDDDLRSRGLEPRTVRRAFLARHGMTFHAWQRTRQLAAAREGLQRGRGVIEAGLEAGYASASGFREAFGALFGTPPGQVDAASACFARALPSPLGPLLAVASDRGLCLLEFADRPTLGAQARSLSRWRGAVVVPGTHAHLDQLERELSEYFERRRREFEVPLDLAGPAFHLEVWRALGRIPYAQTRSYGELARELGRPGAQRAVAGANRANRLAIVVPCHRVVGQDGRLTGYAGGLWRKQRLLELERGSARPPETK